MATVSLPPQLLTRLMTSERSLTSWPVVLKRLSWGPSSDLRLTGWPCLMKIPRDPLTTISTCRPTRPVLACTAASPAAHAAHRTPGLLSSNASLTSDSDSPASVSPCFRQAWSPDASSSSGRFRPRTLSLDAKLSTLRGRGYGGYRCNCQPPTASSVSPRPAQTALSCSSSTSSSSSSEGSNSQESDLGFSRPSGARRSLRNLRAKLDPRNWLQSQV